MSERLADFLVSLVVVLVGAALSWAVLDPWTGFDDANITMNFAENIAKGFGYVYYIGGERVEGSTSAIWTLVNVAGYMLFDRIEPFLAVLCGAISVGIVWGSIAIARQLFRLAGAEETRWPLLVAPAFLAYPGYFAWTVWSLMDIGLFILCVVLAFLVLLRMLRLIDRDRPYGRAGWLFVAVSFPLVAIRPEGLAASLGLAVILFLAELARGRDRPGLVPAAAVLMAVAMVVALSVLRMWYFGQPLPNTFYAKVSISYLEQFIQGGKYSLRYILDPVNLPMLVLAVLAGLVAREWPRLLPAWLSVMALAAGVGFVYTALGGDHFGSFRFFQVLTPLLLPYAVLAAWAFVRPGGEAAGSWRPILAGIAGLTLVLFGVQRFADTEGRVGNEFRLAEYGRQAGTVFNDFESRPSVGVIAAGGIAMTYEGPIKDLLGLNWVEMGHADRDVVRMKNNSGFSAEVFFREPPDLILPEVQDCGPPPHDYALFMDDVVTSAAFRELYAYACYRGTTFFLRRDVELPGVQVIG